MIKTIARILKRGFSVDKLIKKGRIRFLVLPRARINRRLLLIHRDRDHTNLVA
jgi:hypothetical protein